MTVLVIADVTGNTLGKDATAKALSGVKALGKVHLLLLGQGLEQAAVEAAKLDGVTKVLVADDAAYARQMAEPAVALLQMLAHSYSHITAPSTASTKNLLPRLAAKLDVMMLTDVMQIHDVDTFSRPIYAGNAIETVRSKDVVKVFTLRTASFRPVGEGASAQIEAVSAGPDTVSAVWVEDRLAHSERPDLSAARIVVSGGRALGSKENFALIEGLADKLNAAVGASRAAVDSGYAPNDWQVGQTGKVVAPELYVAVGISGAIQHLAGMKDSRIIVAINKDEEAPIFQIADYGLVGDLFAILPELTQKF